MMFGGMGWGAGSFLGPIFMILFWVLLIAGTVWLVLAVSRQSAQRQATTSGRAILEDRLARGEIDLNRIAREELASRGLGLRGEWVGFQKAREIHGIN